MFTTEIITTQNFISSGRSVNRKIHNETDEPVETAIKKEQRSSAGWFPAHPSQSSNMK